jgi:hypothetical protein
VTKPVIQVTVDGQALTGPEAALARAEITIGRGAHDVASLIVGPLSPILDATPGAELAIALGYDDPTDVFTGTLTVLERGVAGSILSAVAATLPLMRSRVAQSYVDQTVADVVSDLLSKAEVGEGEIDAPLALSAYHVDERRTAWRHLQDLARLAGAEVTTTAEGGLNFRPPRMGATADHLLRRGAELAGWLLAEREALQSPWKVAPFGAASESGKEKWQLLLKAPAGDAPDVPYLVPGALRDRDGAAKLEEALAQAAAARRNGGRLVIPGDAAIRAGDLLELEEVDGFAMLRATEVVHAFDSYGFLTEMRVEAVS